jgi:hypothetical protein
MLSRSLCANTAPYARIAPNLMTFAHRQRPLSAAESVNT